MYASNYVSFQAIGDPVFGHPVFNVLPEPWSNGNSIPCLSIDSDLFLSFAHTKTEVNLAESWPKYTPNPHICNTEKERQFPYVYGHYFIIFLF